jgi:type VI secretion system ImpM family protein
MSGVGFYGKLPGAGDFVRRRLPPDFVEAWDRHFQHALEIGRRELGEHWANAWRQGAAWRFVLPPQVCGSGAWCGVTGPAVDRLGREFPMVLAAPCSGDSARIPGNSAWFDALDRVYRSAQDQAMSVETFDAHVAALPRLEGEASASLATWSELSWDSGQWQLELPRELATGAALSEALSEAWRELGMRPGPWCLWWTEGAARLLATRGLPRSHATLLAARRMQAGEVDVRPPAINSLHHATQTTQNDWPAEKALSVGTALSHIEAGESAPASADPSTALLCLDQGRTLLLSADDGPHDPRRLAAQSIRETVTASAHDTASLRTALMSLHARLRDANHGVPHAARENGAAIVVRFDGLQARLLRFGAAALWHWRRGELHAPFVERAVGAGGEFDDLLFGDAWLDMPGLGTPGEPDCDEAALRLEPGDRLLLLATRELMQLPHDCLEQALALPTCDDGRAHLALHAGLRTARAQWPLAVVEVAA